MRLLPTPVSLCLAAAALLPTASPASAAPTCSEGPRFPLTTRIHDAPDRYESGGGYRTWYLDLTNTTTRTCTAIHPVVVLVDGKRALKPAQPRLEFYDGQGGGDGRAHPVRFQPTDEAELVGPFDDGFPGFTVGPGATLTVKVRLAFTPDAVPNEITANAAVVQRHDADGDWVGQSGDYRFTIGDEQPAAPPGTGTTPPHRGHDTLPFADELARTGIDTPRAALAATAAVLLATGGALLLARRSRGRR